MVEAAQVELIKEFEALQAQEHMPTDEQDNEGESEIEVDDCNVPCARQLLPFRFQGQQLK